jgi:hypothetical protein
MASVVQLAIESYVGPVEPDWCPGCGDFAVLKAVKMAAAQAGVAPKDLVVVSGIGCSSNLPGYVHSYGVHSLHGRAVAVASGIKLANTDLKVVITGGDGDGYGIGIGHFIHAMRRNLDLTYVVMNTVLSVAPQVIDAVKGGAIKHFFLVGGCDGAKAGRNYYTEFVEKTPKDTVVLTLACGKFRFFDKKLGDIGGIPRLLDVGQCNDAYSAIQIAAALAGAFNCGVNDLPLSFVLSWYEQKAVAILLTLLHLGIKGIRLGPTLPAFVTPNVLKVLVDNFDIKPVTTPGQDLAAILNTGAAGESAGSAAA